ncbi:MAG: carboxypeptidase-like regulatory domain-containing protein, partial [bacterium]|nr:carboxypeptidase-like regulatory domain-containing protein [bacterium]
MRKLFALFCLLAVFIAGPARAWQMFYRTPVIAGQVLDATTGQPIENAVITVNWVINSYTGLEEHLEEAGDKILITDKNGRYCIPAKTFGHMPLFIIGGSQFHHIIASASHPLYIGAGQNWIKEELGRLKKGQVWTKGQYVDDTLWYDFKTTSLNELYRYKTWDWGDFSHDAYSPIGNLGIEWFLVSWQR